MTAPDGLKLAQAWEHNKIFYDWSLSIRLPDGNIRGTVSFTNRKPQDYTVWGTLESTVDTVPEISVERYENPSIAVDVITKNILLLMADLITRLSRPPVN